MMNYLAIEKESYILGYGLDYNSVI
jgi:hypoxanthine-guanine phosphoribosyltransferase